MVRLTNTSIHHDVFMSLYMCMYLVVHYGGITDIEAPISETIEQNTR